MHGHRSRSLLRHAHPELCSRTHSPLKSWTNTLNGIDGARSPVVSYVVTTETYLGARAQVNGINKRRWRRWHARRAGRRRTAIIFPPEEAKGRKAPMHGVAGRTRRPSSSSSAHVEARVVPRRLGLHDRTGRGRLGPAARLCAGVAASSPCVPG
jgi:hypothetical protein